MARSVKFGAKFFSICATNAPGIFTNPDENYATPTSNLTHTALAAMDGERSSSDSPALHMAYAGE